MWPDSPTSRFLPSRGQPVPQPCIALGVPKSCRKTCGWLWPPKQPARFHRRRLTPLPRDPSSPADTSVVPGPPEPKAQRPPSLGPCCLSKQTLGEGGRRDVRLMPLEGQGHGKPRVDGYAGAPPPTRPPSPPSEAAKGLTAGEGQNSSPRSLRLPGAAGDSVSR